MSYIPCLLVVVVPSLAFVALLALAYRLKKVEASTFRVLSVIFTFSLLLWVAQEVGDISFQSHQSQVPPVWLLAIWAMIWCWYTGFARSVRKWYVSGLLVVAMLLLLIVECSLITARECSWIDGDLWGLAGFTVGMLIPTRWAEIKSTMKATSCT